jgi:hypothetical protein
MPLKIQTASHNLDLGTVFGSTPTELGPNHKQVFEEFPSTRNKNALEIIGEGIILLLDGKKEGNIDIYLEDGRKFRLKPSTRIPGADRILKIETF